MAEKNHIVPTQVISVAGYSLSVMLLAFACALYLGWLPHASTAENLTSEVAPVPVVKSPDTPAKIKKAEAPEATKTTEATPPLSPTDQGESTQTPEAAPVAPTPEDQQKPIDTAEVQPTEQQTPSLDPPKSDADGLIVLPNVTTQEPATQQAEKDEQGLTQPNTPERVTSQDTLTPEDLVDAPERTPSLETAQDPQSEPTEDTPQIAREDGVPSEPKSFASEEAPQEPGLVIKVPGASDPQPREKPSAQANLQPEEPEVRIIVPPASSSPKPEPSPSVVIRIAPEDDDGLKVLPRPTASPRAKPKFIQQSERVVVRVPPGSEDEARATSDPVVVPRTKPFKQAANDSPAPKSDDTRQSRTPKADREVRQSANEAPQTEPAFDAAPAPKPMPKPRRLVRVPSHTASVSPRKRKAEGAAQKKRATGSKPAPAKVVKKRVKRSEPRKIKKRTNRTRNVIEGRRAERRPSFQSVSMDQDTYCLAMAIYYEAGRKTLQAQVIVSRDILHRVESINFPDNVCDVVYQYAHRRGNCRYAFACDGLPDRPRNRDVWKRAKMLARAQISCGSRCGCYLQKPTLVSISAGRNRRVIRCQANYRKPTPRQIGSRDQDQATDLRIEPVASRPRRHAIGAIGRVVE